LPQLDVPTGRCKTLAVDLSQVDFSQIGPFFGGTVTGIIAALTYIGRRRRKPSLSLELDPNLAGTGPTLKKVADNECAYMRLLVHNAGGKDLATGVYVEIEDIEWLVGKAPREVLGLRGMWLAWADRQLTNPQAEKTKESVGAGSAMAIDLVHLNASVPRRMILDVRPQPSGRPKPNHIGESSLSLVLAVNADSGAPKRYRVDVKYDGKPWGGWSEDPGTHLSVEEPQHLGTRRTFSRQR
jgi:hypothetical protein